MDVSTDLANDGEMHVDNPENALDNSSLTCNDPMDVDNRETSLANRSEENTSSLEEYFRTNSLLLASFPWFTSLPMVETKISDALNEDESQYYVRLRQNS
jgi:hypothetical protein